MRNLLWTIAAIGLSCALVGPAEAEIIERIAAVAGDEPITLQDVRNEGSVYYAMQNNDIRSIEYMVGDEKKEEITELVKMLVQRRLVESEAKRLASPVSERDVKQQVEAMYTASGSTEEEFIEYLEQFGIKYDVFKTVIRGELQSQYVMRAELAGQVSISEADVIACARENSPDAEQGIVMDLRQILIREDSGDSSLGLDTLIASKLNGPLWNSVDETIGLVAHGLQKHLSENPQAFKEAVKEFSSGSSATQEGWLGTFGPHELSKDFSHVFALEEGMISEVVKSNAGYHILYVDALKEGESEAWEQAKNQCRNMLMVEEGERLTQSWFQNMMDKNYVSIKVHDNIMRKTTEDAH